jgi:hypothetical protein
MYLSEAISWDPITLAFICGEDCRSPSHLWTALEQFGVEHNERYVGRGELAIWDFTRAMSCEIPPGRSPFGLILWLRTHGAESGWCPIWLLGALSASSSGWPVIAGWENPQVLPDCHRAPSRVAMLLPPVAGECRVAYAGEHPAWNVPLKDVFGCALPQFWTHL